MKKYKVENVYLTDSGWKWNELAVFWGVFFLRFPTISVFEAEVLCDFGSSCTLCQPRVKMFLKSLSQKLWGLMKACYPALCSLEKDGIKIQDSPPCILRGNICWNKVFFPWMNRKFCSSFGQKVLTFNILWLWITFMLGKKHFFRFSYPSF